MPSHCVVVIALDGVLPIDLAVPAQIFGEPSLPYELKVCGVRRNVRTSFGYSVQVEHLLDDAATDAGTVIVPGYEDVSKDPPPRVLNYLDRVHTHGGRVASICTGAFALGAARLLDHRNATTHWAEWERLQTRYPDVRIDRNRLHVRDGLIWTSAGVSSALQLCLNMIGDDLGLDAANHMGRHIVAAPNPGLGQAAFAGGSALPEPIGALASTQSWVLQHLDEALTLSDLANHAAMSTRTLTRIWRSETSMSPHQWLLHARLNQARRLLETTDLNINSVASQCGLGSSTNFRARFRSVVGTTPTAYRRAFSPVAVDETQPGQPV
jgi:transcriptional regulator GlxA family with amidase domain